MNPKISVIIPTYNRAHLIRQAIDSVIAQNVPDVEIIVVDDGSTDETESIVRAYAGAVQYFRTNNGGVAHARNIGTRHARGRFLTYLDSDDRHYPFTLELQSRVLERLPEAAFVCAEVSGFDDAGFFERLHLKTYHSSAYRDPRLTYERIFERGMRLGDVILPPNSLLQTDPDAGERRAFVGRIFDTYLLKLIVCQTTAMFRREVLLQAGARNERIKYWEDVDLLLRICRQHPVCFVDVPTYQLRYHPAQISSMAGPEGKYVWMRKQQILLRVTKRHAFDDGEYYRRHRVRLDRHLAHLHRAAAIPMMLIDTAAAERLGYARRARKYIAMCGRYGRPERMLWIMSYLPGPVRRLGVTVLTRLVESNFGGGLRATEDGVRETPHVGWRSWILPAAMMVAIPILIWLENVTASWMYPLMLHLPGLDKAAHFGQSFILCVALGVLLARTRIAPRRAVMLAAAAVVGAAAFDELQQTLRADRNVEFADVAASVAGLIVGVAALTARQIPRAAAAAAAIGVTLGGGLVYHSYLGTRDYNRGLLAERDGRTADAIHHYLDAITSDPKNPAAYNAAAWSIVQSGHDPQRAVKLAERSLMLRPADADTLDTYGWALFQAGRAADALAPLQAALAAKPDIYCVHYHLALVYLELGLRDEGTRHLRLQVELMPDTHEAALAEQLLRSSEQNLRSHN